MALLIEEGRARVIREAPGAGWLLGVLDDTEESQRVRVVRPRRTSQSSSSGTQCLRSPRPRPTGHLKGALASGAAWALTLLFWAAYELIDRSSNPSSFPSVPSDRRSSQKPDRVFLEEILLDEGTAVTPWSGPATVPGGHDTPSAAPEAADDTNAPEVSADKDVPPRTLVRYKRDGASFD